MLVYIAFALRKEKLVGYTPFLAIFKNIYISLLTIIISLSLKYNEAADKSLMYCNVIVLSNFEDKPFTERIMKYVD